jgi:hypothetical protein
MDEIVCNILALASGRSISDQAICRALAASKDKVNNWKIGSSKPTAAEIKKLAKFFDVSIGEMYGAEPDKVQKNDGLGEPHISSVSEYIAATVGANNKYTCFRGEGRDYGNTAHIATAFHSSEDDCSKLQNEYWDYYRRIYLQLSEDERDNFLAVARHHGLKTNILDATTEPLVALYFACSGEPSSDGIVYCYSNEFADITEAISTDGMNVLSSPIDYFLAHLDQFRSILKSFFQNAREQTSRYYLVALIDAIYRLDKEVRLEVFDSISEQYPRLYNDTTEIRDMLITEETDVDKERLCKKLCCLGQPFCGNIHFSIFLELIYKFDSCAGHETSRLLDILPPMLYRPLISTARYITQSSFLIFQWSYINAKEGINECNIRNITIAAEAKENILKELDALNINRATVYGDRDNIAKYSIGEKYEVEMVPATKLAQLEAQIALLGEKQASLAAELKKSNEQINALTDNHKKELAKRDKRIADLEKEAKQRDKRITELEKENAELKAIIETQESDEEASG